MGRVWVAGAIPVGLLVPLPRYNLLLHEGSALYMRTHTSKLCKELPPCNQTLRRSMWRGQNTVGNATHCRCYNSLTLFPFSLFILNSANLLFLFPPVEPPFLYLSFPSKLSDTHAFLLLLAQPHAFLLFSKHSLKAMHFFTIKYFQVGYLFPSLDLDIL
jgi:hypothetical protein